MTERNRIVVVGTGAWGTTLAVLLARHGRPVLLLARSQSEVERLLADGENRRLLPGVALPLQLAIGADPAPALQDAQVVLLAVPSRSMRQNVIALRPHLQDHSLVLSCAKGIEPASLMRMSEVIAQELPECDSLVAGALSGPNLASEIAAGMPGTTVVAAAVEEAAQRAQAILSTPQLRVYTSSDLIGVELAGALKNIIAIGAGISDGMKAGDNAKAAFITRGLAEIARLGIAMGANALTFAGLAGLGDLVATCASPLSRNHRLGVALAQGQSVAAAQAAIGHAVEGVGTTETALALAGRHGVEMPLTEQLYQILFAGKSPRQAIVDLMHREAKDELHGLHRE